MILLSRQVVLPHDNEVIGILPVINPQIYKDSVMSKYNCPRAQESLLKIVSPPEHTEVKGSNPFILIHLQNEIYFDSYTFLEGGRLATRKDLEAGMAAGLDLKGVYVDAGITLRGDKLGFKANIPSAKNLVLQFKERGIELGKGRLIPFSALTQKEDKDSPYGLMLSLKDDVSQEHFPKLEELNWLYANETGISRAILTEHGRWDSIWPDLSTSYPTKRIVVVKPKICSGGDKE